MLCCTPLAKVPTWLDDREMETAYAAGSLKIYHAAIPTWWSHSMHVGIAFDPNWVPCALDTTSSIPYFPLSILCLQKVYQRTSFTASPSIVYWISHNTPHTASLEDWVIKLGKFVEQIESWKINYRIRETDGAPEGILDRHRRFGLHHDI
jgi:hypothetical protein